MYKKACEYIDSSRDEMLALWEEIVNLESYAREPEMVNALADRMSEIFSSAGMEARILPAPPNGSTVVGVFGADRPGNPVVLSGHIDTVFPTGTFGSKFRIEDGKAYGPGALDMKGGAVIALYVAKALEAAGFSDRPVKILLSGDEEIGHRGGDGFEHFRNEVRGAVCAFNMETGLIDGSLCIGRKGRVESRITVTGVESHAGNDFERGRNAIEEMAYKIIELQKLTNLDVGTTVSVGTISGGTVSNAVPGECSIVVDSRFDTLAERDILMEKIAAICERTHVEGTSTAYELLPSMGAYETTDSVLRFYDFVCKTAEKYGFDIPGQKKLGGSSDASAMTLEDVPGICAFGVQGQWNHTTEEYAVVESLFERAKFVVAVILELLEFEA